MKNSFIALKFKLVAIQIFAYIVLVAYMIVLTLIYSVILPCSLFLRNKEFLGVYLTLHKMLPKIPNSKDFDNDDWVGI